MIAGLTPYPAMKDSGVPWLGKVPEHWTVKRGKALFRCIDMRSSTGEEDLLTVSSERGVVLRSSATVTMFKAESYKGYKLCWPDDLVINSLWAWGRGLGISKHHGIVSSAYGVYRLRSPYHDYAAYIHELVRSTPFNWELQMRSKGIWISRLQLTDEAFLGAPFPLPSPGEQSAIVRFLDHADRKIRRYIRAKQKLIKLLEEQKQAIIHRAVTRGLDPNVRLKPSGLEWLGDIPEHWESKRAKWYFREVDERSPTGSEELLSVSHLTGVTPRSEKTVTMFKAESYAGHKICREGDLVINTMWAWMAALGVARQMGIVSPSYGVYRAKRDDIFVPRFIDLLLRTKPYVADYICRSTGIRSSRLRLYPEQFLRILIMRPPLPEQQEILGFIADSSKELDRTIAAAQREIALLREYRTRLIADVVTGKLDVRKAAAKLPDDVPEPEPAEEIEAPAEGTDAEEPEPVPEEIEA